MKPNEITIDDLVQYGDIHPTKTRVLAISSVDKGKHWHIEVEPENANSMRIVPIYAVKPIPLTAEILEKNGFWHQRNVGYVMEEHENEIIYDLLDHKLRILKNREQILNLECFGDMCVHELQHALRLCGIEKEIVL